VWGGAEGAAGIESGRERGAMDGRVRGVRAVLSAQSNGGRSRCGDRPEVHGSVLRVAFLVAGIRLGGRAV
jgi:hypothetical protein